MSIKALINHELAHLTREAYKEFQSKYPASEVLAVEKLIRNSHLELKKIIEDGEDHTVHAQEVALAWSLLTEKEALAEIKQDRLGSSLKDGTILGFGKYQLLDIGWTMALIQWLRYYDNQVPFRTTPAALTMENETTLAVVGDWGTGFYDKNSPAENVAKVISGSLPDYTIHLGDVYYAGSTEQEKANFVDIWPVGKKGSFTTNSNHEMYTGGEGVFLTALDSYPPFAHQKGTSYFSMQNDFWTLIMLDTAYYADKQNMYLDGVVNDVQIDFLLDTLKRAGDRRIILFSHHEGLNLDGSSPTPLMHTILTALKATGKEALWYWGHAHNCGVDKPYSSVNGRCAGHGAIPYGNATVMAGKPGVEWYETKSANDPAVPVRVLNGFVRLTLQGKSLLEEFVGENGEVRWQNRL